MDGNCLLDELSVLMKYVLQPFNTYESIPGLSVATEVH